MKYGIYYFSGTGNSLWSAKKLAELLEDSQIYPVSRFMIKENKPVSKTDTFTIDDETMIVIFPAYAYEAPLMVRKFIKQADIKSTRIVALTTYGSKYGGALAEIKRLLKRKGHRLDYAAGIKCVENYIPIFGKQKDDVRESRLIRQERETVQIAEDIKNGVTNKIRSVRPLSKIVSQLFRIFKPMIVCLYRVKNTCNGCGICEKVCPAKAITMKEGRKAVRPRFSKRRCEHCQACFNYCPKKSHTLLRLRANKYRYNHPQVGLSEILKQSGAKTQEQSDQPVSDNKI